MTEYERRAIESATIVARAELDTFTRNLAVGADLEALYQGAKPVHEAALGIWCAVVNIIRAQHGLKPVGDPTDAINLNELFGEKENTCGN